MDAAGGGGLQRSEISFRRTGSSGLVWDDKFLGELAKIKPASSVGADADPLKVSSSEPSSLGAKDQPAAEIKQQVVEYKTMKEPSPSIDPPSPKVSGCAGICSVFGGANKKTRGHGGKRAAQVGKRRV